MGPGLLESIYESALCHEFFLRDIPFQRQLEVAVVYKGQILGAQKVDILVDQKIVVELKSLKVLPAVATAQTLSYLKATGLKRALLLNFGEQRLVDGIKRISL